MIKVTIEHPLFTNPIILKKPAGSTRWQAIIEGKGTIEFSADSTADALSHLFTHLIAKL
jgi:hypothetical protein